MIHLLNGNTVERQRNSEGCTVLDCKCAHTPTHWLQMCDADYQPTAALHARAAADHKLQSLAKELT